MSSEVQGTLGNLILNSDSIINYQNDMLNILHNEQERLNQKQNQIDTALNGKVRSIELNESYRKKLSYYTWIIIFIAIIIIIYITLVKIGDFFPFLNPLVDFGVVILFSVAIIYIYAYLSDIRSRSPLDFDILDLKPPIAPTTIPDTDGGSSGSINNRLGPTCVGQECCYGTDLWNSNINKCAIGTCSNTQLIKGDECIEPSQCSGNSVVCGNTCILNTQTCYNTETFTNYTMSHETIPNGAFEFSSYSKF
jgi:hypothetical protein